MHLKSTNGPIDVLVCPEGEEDQRSQSPFSQDDEDDYNPSLIQPELEELTPTNSPLPPPSSSSSSSFQQMLHHHPHHQQQQGHPLTPHTPIHSNSNQCLPPGSSGSGPLPDIHMTPQSHHHHHHQHPHHMAMAVSPADCNSTPGGSIIPRAVDPASMMHCTPGPTNELDISLSSTADVNTDDLEGLMDSYHCDNLDNIDSSALLPTHDMGMLSFESLSPPLQHEDFCFAMEATEGIHDLFDLVA